LVTSIIVDDDFDTVEVFSEYLELSGINVVGKGYNGKDAVDLYQKLKPDVVFLDVLMPDYDGFYALKKIRQLDHDAKIIMVTASLTAQTSDELKDLNASAIIYKPYDWSNSRISLHLIASSEILVVSDFTLLGSAKELSSVVESSLLSFFLKILTTNIGIIYSL